MKEKFEEKLDRRIGRDAGFRVPDGYFDMLGDKVRESLPEKEHPAVRRISRWQRLKPYIYMAAMFAGIWCMMKMMDISSEQSRISLDNPPEAIAQVMTDYADEYEPIDMDTAVDDIELISEVSEEYTSIDDFIDDFGYEIDEKYADIKIS